MSSIVDPQESNRFQPEKATYGFSLLLSGVQEITCELEDALYGGACDDALLSQVGGHIYLDFDRESDSWSSAIISAIKDVENCGQGLTVVRVLTPGEETIRNINALLRARRHPDLTSKLLK